MYGATVVYKIQCTPYHGVIQSQVLFNPKIFLLPHSTQLYNVGRLQYKEGLFYQVLEK